MADYEKINARYFKMKARFFRMFPKAARKDFECMRTRHFARRYKIKGSAIFND